MTKYRKKVRAHVEEHWEESKVICDFCNRDVEIVNDSNYDMTEIEIEAKVGPAYPEGDARDGYRIDTCSACFLTKVKPAIEALGVKFHEYEVENSYVRSGGSAYWADEPDPSHP